ncbi:MAG TPA: hypothetical protein VOA64_05105 [Candidatus Dormibacteraeota bacterium]|nr:hypothetical protein [Candidatus Dormibacteraeota bacterium]
MEYKKPRIGMISEALDLIQSDGLKNHTLTDGVQPPAANKPTIPAYEADE